MESFLYDRDLLHERVNDEKNDEKKLLRVFAISTSSDVIFSLFTKAIFPLDLILSERKGDSVLKIPVIGDILFI